jgi:putative ABC transport system ATP-binding protein
MIKAQNISHFYKNDLALKNINLHVKKAEFISIVGESGSGKSTLLSILSTLLKPTSGDIFLNDLNYKNIKNIDNFRKNNIGFIFQFHYLIDYLSVKENLRIANEHITDEKISSLLNMLDIENLSDKYANEISGGQRQRVAIARSLVNNPSIIFADEPTGNLDSKNSLKVFELLRDFSNNGTTIIVTTHDKELAKLSNKIYEVKDGQFQ